MASLKYRLLVPTCLFCYLGSMLGLSLNTYPDDTQIYVLCLCFSANPVSTFVLSLVYHIVFTCFVFTLN